MSRRHTAANDQSEQVSTGDSQDATDGGADQSLQADGAQLPLEKNDGRTNQDSGSRVPELRQIERLDGKAGKSNNHHKKKTYKNDIHGEPPRGCSYPWYLGRAPVPFSSQPRGGE